MTFSDEDFGEQTLYKSVEDFNFGDLLPYAAAMFKHTFGYNMAVDYDKDQAIFKKLASVHGRNGIKAVKWVFYKHKGIFDKETFSVSWFAANRRWWIDKMVAEMMADTRKVKSTSTGFLSVKDLARGGAKSA